MSRTKTVITPATLSLFSAINLHSSVPVYKQIENLVIFAISSGNLKPGDQLPTILEQASKMKVNPNTITKAYHDLDLMGLIKGQRGMGVFITKDALKLCENRCRESIAKTIYEVMQEAKAGGMDEKTVKNIVAECLKMELQPYTEAPAELMKMGKGK